MQYAGNRMPEIIRNYDFLSFFGLSWFSSSLRCDNRRTETCPSCCETVNDATATAHISIANDFDRILRMSRYHYGNSIDYDVSSGSIPLAPFAVFNNWWQIRQRYFLFGSDTHKKIQNSKFEESRKDMVAIFNHISFGSEHHGRSHKHRLPMALRFFQLFVSFHD